MEAIFVECPKNLHWPHFYEQIHNLTRNFLIFFRYLFFFYQKEQIKKIVEINESHPKKMQRLLAKVL